MILKILNIINFISYDLHGIIFQNSISRFAHVQCSIHPMYLGTVLIPHNINETMFHDKIRGFAT